MSVQRRRDDLAQMISDRLDRRMRRCRACTMGAGWHDRVGSSSTIFCHPRSPRRIHSAFPSTDRMILRSSIKEHKHIAAQMNLFDPLLEEIVFAFQDRRVVERIARITGIEAMEPDAELYAGGISAMSKGAYLRPHLDNSHDKTRERYRVLNLLYYVTPGWTEAYGGSLQLWDDGPGGAPRTIPSRFNRLVLMPTNKRSWHSVNEIAHDGTRCCVSNYYFSKAIAGSCSAIFMRRRSGPNMARRGRRHRHAGRQCLAIGGSQADRRSALQEPPRLQARRPAITDDASGAPINRSIQAEMPKVHTRCRYRALILAVWSRNRQDCPARTNVVPGKNRRRRDGARDQHGDVQQRAKHKHDRNRNKRSTDDAANETHEFRPGEARLERIQGVECVTRRRHDDGRQQEAQHVMQA